MTLTSLPFDDLKDETGLKSPQNPIAASHCPFPVLMFKVATFLPGTLHGS
jgi:hypothetical protein